MVQDDFEASSARSLAFESEEVGSGQERLHV
jgi:hypothetical protein